MKSYKQLLERHHWPEISGNSFMLNCIKLVWISYCPLSETCTELLQPASLFSNGHFRVCQGFDVTVIKKCQTTALARLVTHFGYSLVQIRTALFLCCVNVLCA